mgnify:CR=1 FL=1
MTTKDLLGVLVKISGLFLFLRSIGKILQFILLYAVPKQMGILSLYTASYAGLPVLVFEIFFYMLLCYLFIGQTEKVILLLLSKTKISSESTLSRKNIFECIFVLIGLESIIYPISRIISILQLNNFNLIFSIIISIAVGALLIFFSTNIAAFLDNKLPSQLLSLKNK